MLNVAQLSTMSQSDRTRFNELMRAGQVAFAAGNRRRAHYLWRRAAVLFPYDEQIWLALLNVLDHPDDRRVCLQNIVAINPSNLQAQYQLKEFSDFDQTQPLRVHPLPSEKKRRRWLRWVVRLILAVLVGTSIAVALLLLSRIL